MESIARAVAHAVPHEECGVVPIGGLDTVEIRPAPLAAAAVRARPDDARPFAVALAPS